MKYITATISAGSKLVCNLDYYTNAEGKTIVEINLLTPYSCKPTIMN